MSIYYAAARALQAYATAETAVVDAIKAHGESSPEAAAAIDTQSECWVEMEELGVSLELLVEASTGAHPVMLHQRLDSNRTRAGLNAARAAR